MVMQNLTKFLITVLTIVILSIVTTAFNFNYFDTGIEAIYNPFTGDIDYIRTSNFTGENITADYFFGNINASYIQNDDWVNEAGDTMTGPLIVNSNFTAASYLTSINAIPFNFHYDGSEMTMNVSAVTDAFIIETDNTKLVLYNSPSAGNDFKVLQIFSKEASDVTEFVITKAKDEFTAYFVRSLALVGNGTVIPTPHNCTTFASFIDCKTDTTGPDFYVLDDVEIGGSLYVAGGKFNVTDEGNVKISGEFSGDQNWSDNQNYPSACPNNNAITQLDDSVTCSDDWINEAGDTMSGDLNMSGNNLLDVVNITSAYANKSSIFFLPSGSVGITLDPIFSFVQAQEEYQPKTTRTASTETTCKNGKCNLILYSGVRFVYEDNKWKKIEEAKSLKGIFNLKYLKNDGIHDIEIVDLNYTSIKLRVFIKDSKELNKDIPFKVDDLQKTTKKLTSLTQKATLTFTSNNVLGSNYTFGDKSTTIKLQDADTENLDDTNVKSGNPDYAFGAYSVMYIGYHTSVAWKKLRGWIKFNISSIPSGQQIDDAQLYLYLKGAEGIGAKDGIGVHYSSNDSWVEGPTAGSQSWPNLTWNTQPSFNSTATATIPEFNDTNIWKNWTVTTDVQKDYDNNDANITWVIKAVTEPDTANNNNQYYSKERGTAPLRPYLNITYSEAEAEPEPAVTSTLVSPSDDSTDIDGNVTFNCSATATLSVLKNISLYHNISGTWGVNKTNNVSGTSDSTTFNIPNIPDNTQFIWNCLASNNETNTTFADANWSLSINFPEPKKFFVQDHSGNERWWVNDLGDMWLNRHFNLTGNLIVDTNVLYVNTDTNRVGIGTSSPNQDLHVVGNLNITGNIYVGGCITYNYSGTPVTLGDCI